MATQEKDRAQIKAPTGREIGTPWGELTQYGGFEYGAVYEQRRLDIDAIDRMLDRDGKAKAVEDVLTLPIRSAAWDLSPAKGDTGQADAVREMLTRPANAGGMSTPLGLVIAQATSAITYGKAFFEKVFRTHDGRVVLDKIASRPVSTCELARKPRHGEFAGFRQYPYNPAGIHRPITEDQWVRVPAHRAWVHLHGQHRDPMHGVSDMMVPLWCHETKNKLTFLWFLFAEQTALPRSIVKSGDVRRAQEAAKNFAGMKGGAALAIDGETTVEAYQSTGQGHQQFRELMDWCDHEMAGSVLAGFMNLTGGDGGSYALSKDQSDFFVKSREAVASELAESFTSYVVADLVKYNFGPTAPVPRFHFTSLLDVDVNQAINLLGTLSSAQSSPLPDTYVYQLAEKVAEYLDMDVDKLRKDMEAEGKRRKEQAEQQAVNEQQAAQAGAVGAVSGAVNAATSTAAKEVKRDAARPAQPRPGHVRAAS